MTSMTRRGFATLSGLAMASIAAGCGRSSSPQAASTTGAKIKQGKATGNLTIWAMGAEEGRLPALLKKFTAQNPDCNITMTPIPWSSAHDKITSAIAGGTTPDLTQIGNTWMSEFVGLEAFDPAPSSIDMARFFEGSRKKSVFHGTTYGVPWYVETRCVFWRKDLAREAGITKAPQTWGGIQGPRQSLQEGRSQVRRKSATRRTRFMAGLCPHNVEQWRKTHEQ